MSRMSTSCVSAMLVTPPEIESREDGVNWYAYVGNNPLRYVDPTGMYDTDWWNMSDEEVQETKETMDKVNTGGYKPGDSGGSSGSDGGNSEPSQAEIQAARERKWYQRIADWWKEGYKETVLKLNGADTDELSQDAISEMYDHYQTLTDQQNWDSRDAIYFLSQTVDGVAVYDQSCLYFTAANALLMAGHSPREDLANLAMYVTGLIGNAYTDVLNDVFNHDDITYGSIPTGLKFNGFQELVGGNPAMLIYNQSDFWNRDYSGVHGIAYYKGTFMDSWDLDTGSTYDAIKYDTSNNPSTFEDYIGGLYFVVP